MRDDGIFRHNGQTLLCFTIVWCVRLHLGRMIYILKYCLNFIYFTTITKQVLTKIILVGTDVCVCVEYIQCGVHLQFDFVIKYKTLVFIANNTLCH